MALSPSEEALVRDLIAQNAALLSLASSEPTILSKLGATKATLSDLPVASSLADTDLFLVRQGTTDRSAPRSLVAGGFAALNGSASQVFNVAAATVATHAVRLGQLAASVGSEITFVIPGTSQNIVVKIGKTGSSSINTNGGTRSVTFANAFPAACFAVFPSIADLAEASGVVNCYINNLSASGFVAQFDNSDSRTASLDLCWVAIGY